MFPIDFLVNRIKVKVTVTGGCMSGFTNRLMFGLHFGITQNFVMFKRIDPQEAKRESSTFADCLDQDQTAQNIVWSGIDTVP